MYAITSAVSPVDIVNVAYERMNDCPTQPSILMWNPVIVMRGLCPRPTVRPRGRALSRRAVPPGRGCRRAGVRARRGPENHEQPVCPFAGQEACEVGQAPALAQFRNSAVKGVREHTHPSQGRPRTRTPFPGDPTKCRGPQKKPGSVRAMMRCRYPAQL